MEYFIKIGGIIILKYMYAKEKFSEAVRFLAIGRGDVRSRLWGVYIQSFIAFENRHLPLEFHDDWNWIKKTLTKYPPIILSNGEIYKGSIENTLRRIKNVTGEKIARKIYDIWYELEHDEKYRDVI